MEETTFAADPMRLMIAAAVGIVVLLVLIIKFKLHPVLSMMISAIIIGAGAGMPLTMISDTVEKGVGKTLQGIALLVGLGSMFGGILEVSGGAQRIAETLIGKFGQKKAGWALGLTGLVIGTTVFFEAGVVVLIPLVFSVAKQTRKSTLYYAIPLLSGLASGYAFVPPSAGSVLVANALGVNLGTMIMVGVPTALICMMVSGIFWGSFIGNKIHTELPANVEEIKDDGKDLPPFGLVLGVILIPLVLIPSQHIIQVYAASRRSKGCSGIHRKTIPCTDHCDIGIYVLPGNQTRIYRGAVKENPGSFTQTGRHDPSGNCQRRSDPMDASGFRPWKHYWTGAGEEWASIDPDRISHCTSGQSFCRKFNCSDDNGIRNYGNHAGCNGYQHALQSCYVLCNLWRRNCTEPCE